MSTRFMEWRGIERHTEVRHDQSLRPNTRRLTEVRATIMLERAKTVGPRLYRVRGGITQTWYSPGGEYLEHETTHLPTLYRDSIGEAQSEWRALVEHYVDDPAWHLHLDGEGAR